jgi:hypothetical protein
MNKRFILLLTLLILVPVMLAACGDDDGNNGGGDVSLGQSFETTQEGVTLSFNYPDGWVNVEQDGAAVIATSQEVAESLGGDDIPEIGDDDAGMIFLPFPSALLTLEGDAEEVSAVAAIESFGGQFAGDGEFSLGDTQEATFNGKPAARVTISGDVANGELFVVESTEDFFLFALYVAGNYNDGASSTAESILNSADLSVSE